jgi:hypothetical protein
VDVQPDLTQILFAATSLIIAPSDLPAREEWIRTEIERRFARHGISPATYNLQLL